MGAFFSNVQVRTDRRGFDEVVDALRADAVARDMIEVGVDEDGEVDRTVIVAPPGAGRFVSVYDEASESQDTNVLDALGALVSRAADAAAFTVLVHDSDVLALGIFAQGEIVDRYDSYPEYFAKRSKAGKKPKERPLGAWAPLLAPGADAADLGVVLAAEDLFAEATLAKLCALFGCDPGRATLGQKYLTRDALPLPEGTVTLRLRSRTRPAYETAPASPPQFEAHMPYGVAAQALAEGDELRLGFAAKNAGGASRGVTLTVWGSAIDEGLVDVERFEVVFGNVLEGARHVIHEPERRRSATGATLLVLGLPQQELVAGAPMTGFTPGMDVLKMMSASMRSIVHVNVVGRVVRAGKGSLFAGFVPHAAREAGSHAGQYDLTIDLRFARPLRSIDDHLPGGDSHMLRPLAGTRYLIAMASIDGPRAEASRFAARALELLQETVGGDQAATTIYPKHDGHAPRRPKSGAGKVGSLLRGKRRDKLLAAMGDEAMVDVTVREGPAFDHETGPNPGRWGLSFGASILGDRDGARVAALTVWLDAEAFGEARTREVRAALVALLDDVMRAAGVQASLFRCGATAHAASSAYEQACRLPDHVLTARDYVRRWLRVPGNDVIWLGPSLRSALPAEATSALQALAAVEPCGPATRITLSDAGRAAELERAVAALLPTFDEAHAAGRAFLARG